MQVGACAPIARTRVYVDGFNLYHGRLKSTRFKWLDPIALVEQVLRTIKVTDDAGRPFTAELLPLALLYFTADILDRAARSPDSRQSQREYHNALLKAHGARVEIIKGYYALEEVRAHLVQPKDPNAPLGTVKRITDAPKVDVYSLVEKQSDVNLALRAFCDAVTGAVDQVVVVSNDTDIAPALQMIRQHTAVKIGVIVPTADGLRPVNAELVKHAHWHRRHLLDEELRSAQLPPVLRGGKRPTRKPVSWYPNPALLQKAFAICMEDLCKEGPVWDWLQRPNPEFFEGKAPVDLCESEDGLARIQAYAQSWRRFLCLRAALGLQTFSVEELAMKAKVPAATVRHVLAQLPAEWLEFDAMVDGLDRQRLTAQGQQAAERELQQDVLRSGQRPV